MSEPEEILSRVELQKGAIELSGVEEMKAQTSALKWSKKEGEKFPQEIGQEEVPTTTKDGIGRQWSADDGKLTDTVVFQVETTTEPSYSKEATSIPSVDLDVQSPPLLSSKQPVTKVSGQTLLKEQELIIEQMMAKASDNQGLPEVAKAAEQLREENRIKRAAEIEADNGKLKSALENIHHELEQHKAMVDELKQSVEAKDAENKQLVSEVQRLETKLAATGKAWEEKVNSTESLALIEENHKLKSRVQSLETETEQQKEETEAMRAVIAELQRTAATANVSQRRCNKQGTSIDESKEREVTPEEKKTKRQSENVDISNENSSPSTQGTVSTSGNRQKQQENGQLKNRWKEPKSTSYILSGKKKLIVHSEHRDGANVFAETGFSTQLTRTDNFPGTISGYFELKITETVGKCFHLYIGMYPGGNLNSKLGQKKHSYALHYPILKTKKNVFTGTTTAKQLTTGSADLPKWNRGPGDVVGCGIFPISRHIFFTGNGVILGVYSMGNSLDDLFPAMKVEGVKVETNFGDDPFIMNINELNSLCAEYQHDDDEQ